MAWFYSYLSRHSKKTQSKGTLSEAPLVSVGTPQGSILRPLFFIIHISDFLSELP